MKKGGRPRKIKIGVTEKRNIIQYIASVLVGIGVALFVIAFYLSHQKVVPPTKSITREGAKTSVSPNGKNQATFKPTNSPSNTTLSELKGLANTSSH